MSEIPKGTLYIESAPGAERRPVLEGCTIAEANQQIQEIDRLYDRSEDGDAEAELKLMRDYPEYHGSYFIFVDITGDERMFAGAREGYSIWKLL